MSDYSMTTKTPKGKPDAREIGVRGTMTIHNAGEIRAGLMKAIAAASNVTLDLKKVTEIDLVGLQMICSTHRSAVRNHKLFVVTGGNSPVIAAAALSAGFIRHTGCVQDTDHTCIWIEGGK
jgi:anti-anti-sigma regulatory factor